MLRKFQQNNLLTLSIGIVYLWFGMLKFFPEASPAEGLAIDTIRELTLGFVPFDISIFLLALIEVSIGFSFLLNICRKPMAIIALGHLTCTFSPLFFFSDQSFNGPFALTLLGQYIIKNLVLIAALLSILKMDRKTDVKATMVTLENNSQT